MTPEERKVVRPYETQGIPKEEMIVRFGEGVSMSMSAPAQESRRNTENLNATKGGQTSTTSAEAGNKAIKSISETLEKVFKGTEKELYKKRTKDQKFLDRYRRTLDNPDLTVEEGTALLSDFVRQRSLAHHFLP